MTTDARLFTIRALLAKAEATEYPEEADALMAKASELIAKYAIDEALIWSANPGKREEPAESFIELLSPYIPQKAHLVAVVATSMGCQAIRLMGSAGARSEKMALVGFASDLAVVESLVTSLMVQMTSAMLAEAPRGLSPSVSASWRRSFISGFSERIGQRLTENRKAEAASRPDGARPGADTGGWGGTGDRPGPTGVPAPGENVSSNSTALVLADRDRSVAESVRQRYPRLRRGYSSRGRSASGRGSGQAAGGRADLGHGRIGGRRGALGGGSR